jgi:transposase, IS5 family
MLLKQSSSAQPGYYNTFEEQLSHHHPLYFLANKINWDIFENAFAKLYSDEGFPAKPIRLMVALLMLKHIRTLVMKAWCSNVLKIFITNILAEKNSMPLQLNASQ